MTGKKLIGGKTMGDVITNARADLAKLEEGYILEIKKLQSEVEYYQLLAAEQEFRLKELVRKNNIAEEKYRNVAKMPLVY